MKTGVDDFLVNRGVKAFQEFLVFSWPYKAEWEAMEAEIWWSLKGVSQSTPKSQVLHHLANLSPCFVSLSESKAYAVLVELQEKYGLHKDDFKHLIRDTQDARKAKAKELLKKDGRESEVVYNALFNGLVDLVEHEGIPAFLIKEGDKLLITPELEKDGVIFKPPPRGQIPWLLPKGEEVLRYYELPDEASRLYDDLLDYHKAISELPREPYYDLLVAWDFHTYLLEAFQYTPIICLFAVAERGKSRTGKGMAYVAYRGLHVESLREHYIVRVAKRFASPIFFDVMDIWGKAKQERSEDILLNRYEKGATVPRVLHPERGEHEDMVYFSIFGPTIVATNVNIHRILDTRAVQITMPLTDKMFETDVRPEAALPLKERLVAFRARNMEVPLPNIPKPAKGRLGDILKPLQQVIRLVRPEREDQFLALVKEIQASRLDEKADTLEAHVLQAILSLRDAVSGGILPNKAITDCVNKDKPEREKLSYQKMGHITKAMGFMKGSDSHGNAAIMWDEELIRRLSMEYGLKKTPETPETPESPIDGTREAGDPGESGDSGVFGSAHDPTQFGSDEEEAYEH